MKSIRPSPLQARIIQQAMYAVASADASIEPSPICRESIDEIQRHLVIGAPDRAPGAWVLPPELPTVIDDPQMRRAVVRVLLMLPFVDRQVHAEKAAVVERAAQVLQVEDSGLDILRLAVRRRYRRITFGILHRAIKQFWSQDGRARWQDWADMLMVMLPVLTRSKRALRDRYQSLAHSPDGTLGHTLYRFYRDNGFAMPGEPRSFPEKFVLHEVYHIMGGYPVTHQGEMLAAAFTGGNVERLCMDMILMSLLQYQIGASVAGISRGISGQLKPAEFFHAIGRGAAMNVNLMEDWDFWRVAHRPLDALRREYGLSPLTGRESFVPLQVGRTAEVSPDA